MEHLTLTVTLVFFVFCNVLDAVPTPRIVNGSEVPAGVLPWQVILKKDTTDDLQCGGSVISPDWVLSAGHCTYGLTSIFIIFGTVNIKKYTTSMTSTEFYRHPEYNPENLNNDISLIKLPNSLKFSKFIQPISLVPSYDADNSFIGTSAIIAGFGYTQDEHLEFSDVLLAAMVDIIDNSECIAVYGGDVVVPSTMCARGYNGNNHNICSGDSGGPLVTLDSKEKFIQIGVNSFVAEDACTDGHPSGYARLTSFLDFIESTTNLVLS